MANDEHVAMLACDAAVWNPWRADHDGWLVRSVPVEDAMTRGTERVRILELAQVGPHLAAR